MGRHNIQFNVPETLGETIQLYRRARGLFYINAMGKGCKDICIGRQKIRNPRAASSLVYGVILAIVQEGE